MAEKKIQLTVGEFKKLLREADEQVSNDVSKTQQTVTQFKKELMGLVDKNRNVLANKQLLSVMETLIDLVFSNLSKIKSASSGQVDLDRVLSKLRVAYKAAMAESEKQQRENENSIPDSIFGEESTTEEPTELATEDANASVEIPTNKQQLLASLKEELIASLSSLSINSNNIDGVNLLLGTILEGMKTVKPLLGKLPENADQRAKNKFVIDVLKAMATRMPQILPSMNK